MDVKDKKDNTNKIKFGNSNAHITLHSCVGPIYVGFACVGSVDVGTNKVT